MLVDNKAHGRVVDALREALSASHSASLLTNELSIFAWHELSKVVLAQHRDIQDPEHGGTYTVSEKESDGDGSWKHSRIVLKPDSNDSTYEPIVLRDLADGELRIIAELVEVL